MVQRHNFVAPTVPQVITKSYQRARRSLHVAPATESHAIAFNCRFVGCMHLGFVGSIEPKPNLCSRQGVTLSPISCASPVRRELCCESSPSLAHHYPSPGLLTFEVNAAVAAALVLLAQEDN